MKPASIGLVAPSDDKLVGAKAPPDALAGAPTNYGDVPQLGAPLPGDLGRPILNHQRTLEMVPEDGGDEAARRAAQEAERSEEHTSELQSLMRISYAVFCLKKNNNNNTDTKIKSCSLLLQS